MTEEYILITGATSSIGICLVEKISDRCKLILQVRDANKLKVLLSNINIKSNYLIWEYDLNDLQNIKNNFLNFLILNNAIVSSFIHIAGFVELRQMRLMNISTINSHFNVNLFSASEIISALLKKNFKSHLKNIIFVSSTYAHFGGKGQVIYSASKSAIEGFVRGCAVELSPNILVNCVCPGGIDNEGAKHYDSSYIEKLNSVHLLGLGKPTDVVNMVEFLISDKSNWITGQTFIVDGGYSVNGLKG